MTREYDFISMPDFGFLNAKRNPAVCSRCENKMGAKRTIARFVRSRDWGVVIPDEMAEAIKTHFGVFVFARRILL
jgi:hypothetical protein